MLGSKENQEKKQRKKISDSMDGYLNFIEDALDGTWKKKLKLKECEFWLNVLKAFFKKIYTENTNCEKVYSWNVIDEALNFLYKTDALVKRFLEYHYGENFDAHKSFNDYSDILFLESFIKMYKPKLKHMIVEKGFFI